MADSNFLLFNEAHNETRTYNDSEYKNATQRQTGVIPGMALSRMHNKMYYQWSAMCKAIADGLVKAGYDCYDYDVEGIANNFKTWLDSAGMETLEQHNTDPDAHQNLKTLIQNSGINILKRSHEYEVGDIAYTPLLKSYQRLECVVGGVTASSEIDISSSTTGGALIDGSCTWLVVDVRDGTPVGTVRGSLYLPAGYIVADGSTVQRADYPRLVALADEHNLWRDENVSYTITGTTVAENTMITAVETADLEKIRIGDTLTATQLAADTKVTAIDYAANTVTISVAATTADTKISIDGSGNGRHEGLFGRGDGINTLVLPNYIDRMIQLAADNAGLYLDAGLANIVATCTTCYNASVISQSISGAFYEISGFNEAKGDDGHWFHQYRLGMNASRSNSIYGNSKTVQPPAITLLPILRY